MQSLRLAGVPQIPPSFRRHRFDSDPSRFSLNLSLSKPIATPCWASLPSPPMSGSPPPEHPLELPQTAGRRRKRSDTPTTHAPSRVSTPVVTTPTIVSGSPAERRVDVVATTGSGIQQATWPTPYPVAHSYGFGAGASVLAEAGPDPSQLQPQYVVGPTSPKATRKSKVHVPSACVNCKQKHLRCDNSRPCHRCVQSGKEDTCVDVQHKKRGRPPLKPDDSASRRFAEPESNRTTARLHQAPPGASESEPQLHPFPYPRQSIAPRNLPPQPVAQQGDRRRPPMRLAPSPSGLYASPSVGSSYAAASGTTYNPPAQRPLSSSSSQPSSQPPSPYYQTPSAGTSPEGPLRSTRGYSVSYSHQPIAQELYPPSTGPYRSALFPRPGAPQQAPFEAPASAYAPQQSIAPELQLPPIRPAPPGLLINPAMAQQQQRQAQHQQEREGRAPAGPEDTGTTRQPDPKRPRMSLGDIVNPRNDE